MWISHYRTALFDFKNCLSSYTFLDVWKKANIIPIHEEGDKQVLKNYRSVSLLPICGKIFENLIFNAIYFLFEDHKLLNPRQSGFKKNDFCINQLVSITHQIYSAFECDPSLEVRGVFLDLSKAFDNVWHDGLIYKLKLLGISGSLLKLIQNYLDNRFQRVFPRVQFFDHYFLWFILMIFVVIYQLMLNSSLILLLFFL